MKANLDQRCRGLPHGLPRWLALGALLSLGSPPSVPAAEAAGIDTPIRMPLPSRDNVVLQRARGAGPFRETIVWGWVRGKDRPQVELVPEVDPKPRSASVRWFDERDAPGWRGWKATFEGLDFRGPCRLFVRLKGQPTHVLDKVVLGEVFVIALERHSEVRPPKESVEAMAQLSSRIRWLTLPDFSTAGPEASPTSAWRGLQRESVATLSGLSAVAAYFGHCLLTSPGLGDTPVGIIEVPPGGLPPGLQSQGADLRRDAVVDAAVTCMQKAESNIRTDWKNAEDSYRERVAHWKRRGITPSASPPPPLPVGSAEWILLPRAGFADWVSVRAAFAKP